MRASKKSLPLPNMVTADALIEFTGLDVTPRWIRQLAKDRGFQPKARGLYDLKASVRALLAFYRDQQSRLAARKQAIADEDHRKKKRENDLADELLVERAAVVADFKMVAEPVKLLLRQKLENEYPLAVAGLDVPQARIYGKRLEDDILVEFQKIFSKFKTKL